MSLPEMVLYQAARTLYRTEVAHSNEMKAALEHADRFDAYRSAELPRIQAALDRYGLSVANRRVLDFGCNDGALTMAYAHADATHVTGVDVDGDAVLRAAKRCVFHPRVAFRQSTADFVPLDDASVDLVVSYDVFEHVSKPEVITRELYRALAPGGKALIGTWSWRHPFAPHLWAVMPVPWAHLLVSERTLLRASRRVYQSRWYRPTLFDVDANGQRVADKYTNTALSRDFLNQFLIRDFERVFAEAGFTVQTEAEPFGAAPWMRPLLRVGWIRELCSRYVWFVLTKP